MRDDMEINKVGNNIIKRFWDIGIEFGKFSK